jgi:hypothetical protein
MKSKSAIACLIVGIGCGGFSLFGYFDRHVSYCNAATNPCTPVVISGWQYPKNAKFVSIHQGWGLLRTASGAMAAISLGAGYFASGAASVRQQKSDESIALEEARQKQLEATKSDILDDEEIQKTAIASDLRVKDFKRELYDGYNTLYLESNPELLEALTAASSDEPEIESKLEKEVSEPALPATKTKAEAKAQLKQLIEEHEGGWIKQLMKKPILIYGDMGFFKSYFAAFLALARHYLHDHQIISITDPHFHQNCDESWKYLVKLGVPGYGSNQNYSAIGEQLNEMYDRFAHRTLKDKQLTSIWDEVTNYSLYKECEQPAKMLLRKTMSDPRKANESPILIGHDNTLVALGGSEGFSKSRNRGLIQLELFSDSENSPLLKGNFSGIKTPDGEFIDSQEVSIQPEWIRPEWVFNLFNLGGNSEVELKLDPKLEPKNANIVQPKTENETKHHTEFEPTFDTESAAQKLEQIIDISTSWDYWLAETTPEELDRLLELRHRQSTESVDNSVDKITGKLSDLDKPPPQEIIAQPLQSKTYSFIWSEGDFARFLPDCSELELFEKILDYLDKSRNASEIIQKGLGFSKPANHKRSYSKIGKPCFKYLVRKYGSAAMIAEFKVYLDKD